MLAEDHDGAPGRQKPLGTAEAAVGPGAEGAKMPSTKQAIALEARKLLDRHGDRAVVVAEEMIAHLVAIGDDERAEEWRQIVQTIVSMRGTKPAG